MQRQHIGWSEIPFSKRFECSVCGKNLLFNENGFTDEHFDYQIEGVPHCQTCYEAQIETE